MRFYIEGQPSRRTLFGVFYVLYPQVDFEAEEVNGFCVSPLKETVEYCQKNIYSYEPALEMLDQMYSLSLNTRYMEIKTNELNAIVSGGAELIFKGTSNIFDVSITGAGNIDAQKFEVQECKIDISGFGRAKVNALKNLEVNISGAGKVEYIGNPEVKQSITGAGKIYKKI